MPLPPSGCPHARRLCGRLDDGRRLEHPAEIAPQNGIAVKGDGLIKARVPSPIVLPLWCAGTSHLNRHGALYLIHFLNCNTQSETDNDHARGRLLRLEGLCQ